MADLEVDQEVQERLDAFASAMAGLGITVTEEEIAQKRKEIQWEMGGNSALAVAEGGEAESWEDVQRVLEEAPDSVAIVDDYVKLDLKEQLVNIPFWVNKWWFSEGDQGEYATMQCLVSREIMTPTGPTRKIVITDGSTGIFQQLRKITMSTGQSTRLIVRNGLRVSRYTVDTDEGEKNAETFYLN